MDALKDNRQIIVGVIAVLLIGLGAYISWPRENYSVQIVMTNVENLAVGGKVWINGFDSGWVESIDAKDGKALVRAGIAPGHVPLHAGTRTRIQWYAALGERVLTIYPGPASNPEIPNGGLLQAESDQVEVDEVLAALDMPTRQKLNGLIDSLHATTAGKEPDVAATLRAVGPTVQAAGAIFDAIGRDGPAVHQLVQQLQRMIQVTAQQQGDVAGTVHGLDQFAGALATQQTQLSSTLHELPATLNTANVTLKDIPPAADSASDMLHDLHGATRQLPRIADDLAPFVRDLRPTVRDLGPTLRAASDFLDSSPRLLDDTHVVLPEARKFVKGYRPAISFLRPYTPELMGWIQNWGKNFAAIDSQGHLWSALVGEATPQAFDDSPSTLPPVQQVGEPKPGAVVNQPWNDPDATGAPAR
jgi:phospholipid/cholesterol/gamma-HCH transport system substrate-binding protein